MSSFILIDELFDFTNELIELMKEDWKKFKIFIKEYKKYMFWILVLFITMQFTDLMSLGTSWERYCKKNDINTTDSKNIKYNTIDNKNIDNKNIKYNNIKKIQTGGAGASSESKDIARKIGWFKQFKGQMTGNLGTGAGPVFGNFERIFKYTEALFVIVTSLLIIIGVISLPVLIFIIVAYCVLKKLVKKFTVL